MSLADQSKPIPQKAIAAEKKRAIAYSMDTLIPGLYIWLGDFSIRILGTEPDDTEAGYTIMGSAPAKGGRVKVWWSHEIFSNVESIYSEDKSTVITAYHV
jgi:hypothetical protein